MSINFWIPQAPVARTQPYPDEPDYWEVNEVEPFGGINMTAGNGNAILELIDPISANYDEDPHGVWDQAKLPLIRAACIRALNTSIKDKALLEEVVSQMPGCAVVYSGGRDAGYVKQRLERFMELTKVAMDHGFDVHFG